MDHVVYLDHKAKELDNLRAGKKTVLVRGAMGRKIPYGRVNKADVLYFIENNGDGLIKAKAIVERVYNSEKLTKEDSLRLISNHQDKLLLNEALKKRFGGKRYLTFVSVKDFRNIEPFFIDKSNFENMDDWLLIEEIDRVKKRNEATNEYF